MAWVFLSARGKSARILLIVPQEDGFFNKPMVVFPVHGVGKKEKAPPRGQGFTVMGITPER
jgi:hypothetical protein